MATMLRHIPNLITLARIVACLPLVVFIVDGDQPAALWLALAVGISDVLDGFLARRFSWQSRIGGLLDPVADKLFLVSAFLALGWIGAVPLWLIVLVMVRDAVIVAGAVAYNRWVAPVPAEPTVLGKASTVGQVLLILVVLAGRAGLPLPGWLDEMLVYVVAALALVSGAHYVQVWSARARAGWHRQRNG